MAQVTTQTHDIVARASKIWNDGADIALLPYPDVRLIQDPSPTSSGGRKVGDILQDLGIAQGPSPESLDVVKNCDSEWTTVPADKPGTAAVKPPGVTLVFVRDFGTTLTTLQRELARAAAVLLASD